MACASPENGQQAIETAETDCRSLPECFDFVFKMHQYFDKTDDSSSSDKFQGKLRQAIESTQRAIRMVNDLDLFSRNEDIDEVSTNEVKYMLLSAFLAYFTGLNTHMPRSDAVMKSKLCYIDFLKLLKTYGVIEYDISLTEGDDGDDDIENVVPSNRISSNDLKTMSVQRNNKIQRFKEKKEMERKIAELQTQVEKEHVDDEIKREFYLTQIKHWANVAIDEVDSCNLELQMLKHRQGLANSGSGNTVSANHTNNHQAANKVKPFRPFILTKTNLQKQVFGAGYPAIPTMTVDEFYEQKLREGHLSESVQGHSLQNWAADPERDAQDREKEAAEKEEKEEREDEETIQRARAMDDWKDVTSEFPGASKKSKRTCTFRPQYTETWPCLVQSKRDFSSARCTVCNADFSNSHGGKDDCRRHIESQKHVKIAKESTSCKPISHFLAGSQHSSLDEAVTRAEVIFSGFLVEHNIALAAADHAGKLFQSMFLNSEHSAADIIRKYSSARTKTTHLVREMASHESTDLVSAMKNGPFSLATNASNDKADKLFPVVVRMCKDGAIVTELMSLLQLSDKATGFKIAQLLKDDLTAKGIPWKNCMAFACDNANVMVGLKQGVYAHLLEENANMFLVGCICHCAHLAAEWASRELPVSPADLFQDIFYYIEKSSLRTKSFQNFQEACGTPKSQVKKHCTTRWLSLEDTCKWVLEQWDPLLKYFKNECEGDKSDMVLSGPEKRNRKKNALESLRSKTMKLYILYLSYILSVFNAFNVFFQQEGPVIHLLRRKTMRLVKDLMLMFVQPTALNSKLVTDIDFEVKYNLLPHKEIMVGSAVRAHLDHIDCDKKDEFFTYVTRFLQTACRYLLKNGNLQNQVLACAEVADIGYRDYAKMCHLKFCIDKFQPSCLQMLQRTK
ncbi:immunoglobulin-binding protein 1-like [Plakobranchus ocellatus]|uniref:Immunoglobulin-binding protein 1-like n=1 Tax=Plakobranchus ocellatus TaxID=259542 RepID=A0AAV3YW02_9GAST|nr:immunoglobulin-binding protein 1-like [Plakobranchus ocellatus]